VSPIYSMDVETQSILQYGWDYVRANLHVLDDIFGNFKESHLQNVWGDKEINKIKTWIEENDIPIVLAWGLQAQAAPQISVHLSQVPEDVGNAFMSDWGGIEEEIVDARTIVDTFVPESYAITTTTITVPATSDLTLARPGHILKDAKGEDYMIEYIVGQEVTIMVTADSAAPDMSKATIKSFITTTRYKRGEAYFKENIDIGIHGHGDQNTVLWMYYIVVWILLRFKQELEKRCMDLSTFSASDFNKNNQYLGENIYSRWVRFTARTRVSWKEDVLPQIDTIVATVRVDEDGDC
jgi:hypothetical protein